MIASGGLAGLEDIKALLQPQYRMLEGAIAGRALYDGRLDAVPKRCVPHRKLHTLTGEEPCSRSASSPAST